MRTLYFVFLLTLIAIIYGCGSYTISRHDLVSQLEESQDVKEILHWTPIGYSKYPSNRIDKIKCINSKGELIYLYPNQNTTIIITSKSSDKKFRAYFDTVFYKDGKLFGLRSRIIGGMQEIDVNDIDKIEFHVELPKTKRIEDPE